MLRQILAANASTSRSSTSNDDFRTTAREVGNVNVVRLVGKQPRSSLEEVGNERSHRRNHLTPVGDLRAQVGGKLAMEMANQARCTPSRSR